MSDNDYMKWVGGRKFSLALVSLIITSVLLLMGKVDSQTFQMIIIWVVSAYITGNVTQTILTK